MPPYHRPRRGGAPRRRPRPPGRVRIIAGRYRGRFLDVLPVGGLRPTTDRMRVQLFSWLDPHLPGARVLDLCAGTGALGCEALSRGAVRALFVEHDPALAESLGKRLAEFSAPAEVVTGDARRRLDAVPGPFTLVFLDPPFEDEPLRRELFAGVLARDLVARGGFLVLESPRGEAWPEHPAAGWTLHRRAVHARAELRLYRREDGEGSTGHAEPRGGGSAERLG
ncbi:MAG: 16S rRNA (guanine(966)-N(2))-methyltransferase RsmD [Gammaproteobacteria bacterium]|nr:16S rRNA (guanine(966)-N(2))-methyltransferase RsmD [Gammaproteobacteria bacterium]